MPPFDLTGPMGMNPQQALEAYGVKYMMPPTASGGPAAPGAPMSQGGGMRPTGAGPAAMAGYPAGLQRFLMALRLIALGKSLLPAGAAMSMGGDQGPAAFSGDNFQRYLQMMGQAQEPVKTAAEPSSTATPPQQEMNPSLHHKITWEMKPLMPGQPATPTGPGGP